MFMNILFLLVGFYALIKGANYLVDGASSIAARLKISPLVIGLTIVAFGTSAPELVVNVISASTGANQVAIGNILGSNMANILLVLGLAAIIKSMTIKGQTVTKEIPFSLLAAIMVLVAAGDTVLDGAGANIISRTDGLAFLGFFLIFMYYTFLAARALPSETRVPRVMSRNKSILLILAGLAALFIGGQVIVENAVAIATTLGVSQTIIGLTIVALGTSLPELATAIIAVKKGETDLAVGGVVGSNIFNIFLVLGITSVIAPIPFEAESLLDAVVVIAASLVFFAAMYLGERHRLDRWMGSIMLASYLGYISFRVISAFVI